VIAIVDVQYAETRARVGCVLARDWLDAAPAAEHTLETEVAAAYVPGEFYRRELPPVLEVLRGVADLATVIIDAHVWLGPDRPGLGARLHDALGGAVAVVGVAKNAFSGAPSLPVIRNAARPLYVSAIGLDPREAAAQVAAMHGPYRIPALIRRADQLARGRSL
jgi:deoxyribonuclease V